MRIAAYLLLLFLLLGCAPPKHIDSGVHPTLTVPETIAHGLVGDKDINDNWRVDVFTNDGQKWSIHDKRIFYHVHLGQRVNIVRYSNSVTIKFEEAQ